MLQAGIPGPPDAPAGVPGAPEPPPGPEEPLEPGFPQDPEEDTEREEPTPQKRRLGTPPESIFRAVNDTIFETALGIADGPDAMGDFLCECGHPRCLALVEMLLVDYETVRSMPNCFLVRDGHDAPWIHQVVARTEKHLIVERRLSPGR